MKEGCPCDLAESLVCLGCVAIDRVPAAAGMIVLPLIHLGLKLLHVCIVVCT